MTWLAATRGCQLAIWVATWMTCMSRRSFRCAIQNSTGSRPARNASSSTNDSLAHVFWIRAGERSGPAMNEWTPVWLRSRWLGITYDGPELELSTVFGLLVGVGGGEAGSGSSGRPSRMPVGRFAGGPGRPPRLAVQ